MMSPKEMSTDGDLHMADEFRNQTKKLHSGKQAVNLSLSGSRGGAPIDHAAKQPERTGLAEQWLQ